MNVALIGFMGTGKSAVGQALAKKIGWQFVEMDSLIEKLACKSIPDIFREDGEIVFREFEIESVKQRAAKERQVIACGGGVVLNTINVMRLRATGVTVLLTASPAIILERTSSNPRTRPMLNGDDIPTRINDLLKYRKPFYDKAADIEVNTSRIKVETVVKKIIEKLRKYEGFNIEK